MHYLAVLEIGDYPLKGILIWFLGESWFSGKRFRGEASHAVMAAAPAAYP
jgi:hypothetical protein